MLNVNEIPQGVKFAVINKSGATTSQIVAAVSGARIRVLGYVLSASGAATLTWITGTSTAISGGLEFVGAALVPFSAGFNPVGHFQTEIGERLALSSDAAVDADGHLVYIEVEAET